MNPNAQLIRRSFAGIYLAPLFALIISPGPLRSDEKPTADQQTKHLLLRLKMADLLDSFKVVQSLYRKKNGVMLQAIGDAGLFCSSFAVNCRIQLLEPDLAVAYCAAMPLGSEQWDAAMRGLLVHPKKRIIGYLKQVATSSLPHVRYYLYTAFKAKRWNDLVPFATKDADSTTQIGVPGARTFETLGRVAQEYIEATR